MRIHYLQHVAFEGLGFIETWARKRGHSLKATALFRGQPLPPVDDFDLLVVMGGPMGVYDYADHAWLTQEKQFIEKVLRKGKKALGICLGAQLIADVLGGKVYKNQHKEIGWHPVTRVRDTPNAPLAGLIPERFLAFHWHGDTFDLPAGTIHLTKSEACRHQAFFYPPGGLGLQFHLESTRKSIEALITHCGHELVPGPYIQGADEIRSQSEHIDSSNDLMGRILTYFEEA